MQRFSHEFNKNKEVGENFYIYAFSSNNYRSGICTCGHYDEELKSKIPECPNCKTKAIININCSNPGINTYSNRYLNYLNFNNDEFILDCKKINVEINFETFVENNMPIYKIVKDSLKINIEDLVNLKFYYTTNKKGKVSIKSEFYVLGEKKSLLSYNCPSLYGSLFINDKTSSELNKINIERYSSLDIWKIYSYYKNAPGLIKNGFTNFSGSVSEIRTLNALFNREEIKPIFKDIIEKYKYITKNGNKCIDYYDFQNIYGIKRGYYDPVLFDNDFIKYVLSIDNGLLRELYDKSKNDTSVLLNILYGLKYSVDEANNFLNLVIRQNASIYNFCDNKTMQIIRLFEKYGIEIEKNPKDIRIFIAKLTLLKKFDNYVYYSNTYAIDNSSLGMRRMGYEEKSEEITKFFSRNANDFFSAIVELAIEKSTKDIDVALLIKNNTAVDDCLLILNDKDKIVKILYEDNVYDNEESIKDFLLEIENEYSLAF